MNIKIGNILDCDISFTPMPIRFLRLGRWEVAVERCDHPPIQYGLQKTGTGEWQYDTRRYVFLITNNVAWKAAKAQSQ